MDERRADHESDDHRRKHRAAGAERDVVEQIEELGPLGELAQELQHQSSPLRRSGKNTERIFKSKATANGR
jgi:hypothetical protein